MKIIIDRFEGNIAVVELPNGNMEQCPKSIFPDNVQEGDIISISIDKKETEEKRTVLTERLNRLLKD